MVEPTLPEAGHLACPVDERRQGAELRAIMRLATFMAVAHQPGEFENAQMLGYGGLRDTRLIGQRSYGLLPVPTQPFENRTARRVGEGPEEDVGGGEHVQPITHGRLMISITNGLWISQGRKGVRMADG